MRLTAPPSASSCAERGDGGTLGVEALMAAQVMRALLLYVGASGFGFQFPTRWTDSLEIEPFKYLCSRNNYSSSAFFHVHSGLQKPRLDIF